MVQKKPTSNRFKQLVDIRTCTNSEDVLHYCTNHIISRKVSVFGDGVFFWYLLFSVGFLLFLVGFKILFFWYCLPKMVGSEGIPNLLLLELEARGGDSLIKVGTDVWAWALGISGVDFCLGIRFWEVNFTRALGFWQFLTKKCVIIDKRVTKVTYLPKIFNFGTLKVMKTCLVITLGFLGKLCPA